MNKPLVCDVSPSQANDHYGRPSLYSAGDIKTRNVSGKMAALLGKYTGPISLFALSALGYSVLVAAGRQYLQRRAANYQRPAPMFEDDVAPVFQDDLES